MKTSNNEVIDPTNEGNLARMINHSCDPNCEIRKWNVLGETCVGIFALRDINENEEFSFNYGFDSYRTPLTKCYCGSDNCKGYLGVMPVDMTPERWEEKLENMPCSICGHLDQESDDADMLLCDNCNRGFHTYCLNPPVLQIPKEQWYCQQCNSTQTVNPQAIKKPTRRKGRPRKYPRIPETPPENPNDQSDPSIKLPFSDEQLWDIYTKLVEEMDDTSPRFNKNLILYPQKSGEFEKNEKEESSCSRSFLFHYELQKRIKNAMKERRKLRKIEERDEKDKGKKWKKNTRSASPAKSPQLQKEMSQISLIEESKNEEDSDLRIKLKVGSPQEDDIFKVKIKNVEKLEDLLEEELVTKIKNKKKQKEREKDKMEKRLLKELEKEVRKKKRIEKSKKRELENRERMLKLKGQKSIEIEYDLVEGTSGSEKNALLEDDKCYQNEATSSQISIPLIPQSNSAVEKKKAIFEVKKETKMLIILEKAKDTDGSYDVESRRNRSERKKTEENSCSSEIKERKEKEGNREAVWINAEESEVRNKELDSNEWIEGMDLLKTGREAMGMSVNLRENAFIQNLNALEFRDTQLESNLNPNASSSGNMEMKRVQEANKVEPVMDCLHPESPQEKDLVSAVSAVSAGWVDDQIEESVCEKEQQDSLLRQQQQIINHHLRNSSLTLNPQSIQPHFNPLHFKRSQFKLFFIRSQNNNLSFNNTIPIFNKHTTTIHLTHSQYHLFRFYLNVSLILQIFIL